MLVGFGYDIHRLEPGLPLVLGGVPIPGAPAGAVAHSDGDVVLHALCDAMLGAAALNDIGHHFPDTDPQWKGAASLTFVREVVRLLEGHGLAPHNVDCMLILERPKIAPYREEMRAVIADVLGLAVERVSVKATTHEGMGPIGEGRCVVAHAVATLVPLSPSSAR